MPLGSVFRLLSPWIVFSLLWGCASGWVSPLVPADEPDESGKVDARAPASGSGGVARTEGKGGAGGWVSPLVPAVREGEAPAEAQIQVLDYSTGRAGGISAPEAQESLFARGAQSTQRAAQPAPMAAPAKVGRSRGGWVSPLVRAVREGEELPEARAWRTGRAVKSPIASETRKAPSTPAERPRVKRTGWTSPLVPAQKK